jgi:hypothetical protein
LELSGSADIAVTAAVLMGDRLRRAATIRQGVGSEIRIQLGPDGTVDVGGACAVVNVRDYPSDCFRKDDTMRSSRRLDVAQLVGATAADLR